MSSVVLATNGLKNGAWRESGYAVRVNFGDILKKLTESDFEKLCLSNKGMRFERAKERDILIMAPVYTETGGTNFNLNVSFGIWVRKDGKGRGFDSSTAFTLPNGAIRSPDLA
jgi:Uma2 family endonuclease